MVQVNTNDKKILSIHITFDSFFVHNVLERGLAYFQRHFIVMLDTIIK